MVTRRTAGVTALGAAALLVGLPAAQGLVPGGPPAPSPGPPSPVSATLAYRCVLPSGTHDAEVTLTGTFPRSVAPGEAVRVRGLTLRTVLPAEAAAGLPGEGEAGGPATLAGSAVPPEATPVPWEAEFTAAGAPTRRGASVELTHTGEAAPVTPARSGAAVFTAGPLTFGTGADEGADPNPGVDPGADPDPGVDGDGSGGAGAARAAVRCAPADGADPTLATVTVEPEPAPSARPDGSPGPAATPAPSARDTPGGSESPTARAEGEAAPGPRREPGGRPLEGCPEPPTKDALDRSLLPEPPADAQVFEAEGGIGCTVPVGYANVDKQRAAMVLNDPSGDVEVSGLRVFVRSAQTPDGRYLQAAHVGDIVMPPSTSTFVNFDFMPVTARVELDSLTPATIVMVQRTGEPTRTTVGYDLQVRIAEARVNGVPLPVGPDCRTSEPIPVRLSGQAPHYDVLGGGLLTGEIDLPAFTGCGVGEDLDPLFTASVSGPGNHLRLNQGPVCNEPCTEITVPALPKR
ncbi:DUF6801 domain-containing protein [Streptomyces sp. TRM70308]|uniref:DUF6801 domain-containing protein n=1 Tax=Streptomyces sp. TRM70308 TaxID=3131932 RepID=UPI003D09534E